jgi:threonine dehydratase
MNSILFSDVQEAHDRIKSYIHQTPVLTCSYIDSLVGMKVYFKCENLQKVGAFKFRGAMNAMLQLTEEEKKLGVVTHSSGNHAQALALAASLLGIKASIVMPNNAPSTKLNAVLGYGASVITSGNQPTDRIKPCNQIILQSGAIFIHPSNQPRIIAGAGTAALELMNQTNQILDAIIAPVGGGGLLAGTSIAVKGMKESIIVFGAEPKDADDAHQSLHAGYIIPNTNTTTIADGLRSSLGDITFPIILNNVREIILVSDIEIEKAMYLIWQRMKIIVEPSGAVPLAAILSPQFKKLKSTHDINHIGVILSGGNLDLTQWKWSKKITNSQG